MGGFAQDRHVGWKIDEVGSYIAHVTESRRVKIVIYTGIARSLSLAWWAPYYLWGLHSSTDVLLLIERLLLVLLVPTFFQVELEIEK